MKVGKKKFNSYHYWRGGQNALWALAKRVDRMIEALIDEELPHSPLIRYKLLLDTQLRDNAFADIRWRKEKFELLDMELAREGLTDAELLAKIEARLRGTPFEDKPASDTAIHQMLPDDPAQDPIGDHGRTENVQPERSGGSESDGGDTDPDLGPENDG